MRKSIDDSFYALHLLYAPPVNRGNVCLLEDFPDVYNLDIQVGISEKIKKIVSVPDGTEIEFEQSNGVVSLKVDKFNLHKMLVFIY